MLISAIVAVSENNVIGRDGHLPWHLSADLKRFKAITTGHSIILGRKNYDDIGRPLPNRTNYVLTRNKDFQAPGCIVCSSLELAIEAAKAAGETECFIIGGAAVYREAMPLVDKLYYTKVLSHVDGDVFFPEWVGNFAKISEEMVPADEKNDFPTLYQVWVREK
jgi:dihydrofolate reductase